MSKVRCWALVLLSFVLHVGGLLLTVFPGSPESVHRPDFMDTMLFTVYVAALITGAIVLTVIACKLVVRFFHTIHIGEDLKKIYVGLSVTIAFLTLYYSWSYFYRGERIYDIPSIIGYYLNIAAIAPVVAAAGTLYFVYIYAARKAALVLQNSKKKQG